MPGLADKIRKLIGVDEYEDEYYPEDEYDNRPQERAYQDDLEPITRPDSIFDNMPRGTTRTHPPQQPAMRQSQPQENVIQLPRSGRERLVELTTKFNIMVIEPKDFEMCPKLVDSLKNRKPVIVNLEKVETKTARKIFDFLSGATYALSGDLQNIANNIFVFLPMNVDVTTNMEHSGMTFGSKDGNPWKL
jgi:cell division inhibitor SepF